MAFFGTDYTGYTDVGDFSLFSQFPDETEKKRIRLRRKKTHSEEGLEPGGFGGGRGWCCDLSNGGRWQLCQLIIPTKLDSLLIPILL